MRTGTFCTRGLGMGMAVVLAAASASAISPDNQPSADNSVEAELKSFSVHEDFEVSLFADESLGIANPIALHWDPRGRLWVLCTLAYAQLKPGELPDDKLFILEDTDGDGKADKSAVFASGLEMSTGFALAHGGVYLAEGHDLLFLRDNDGDDKADERKLILTGFGTGDTHQNISNLTVDSGGFLYFTQGLHALSQVETPWGVSRGDTAGFWRFDPRITKLDSFGFPSMTSQNPCGVALDRWGALFIKSNGPHLCFATPGLIPTTHSLELMQHAQVGQTPGKSMGVDIVETSHMPEWIQGHAIIAGYFAREVSAIPMVEEGAGFAVSQPIRLVYGGHESFRPVDIRQGPEGALYVADWFNPVINHYQVSLRHPDRDYSHGRIWKISAKGGAKVDQPDLESLSTESLFEQLRSGERWTRDQARRLLSDREKDAATELISALTPWAESLDPALEADSIPMIEAAAILESYSAVTPAVLDRLEASTEPRVRAVVARVIGRSPEPIPDAKTRLRRLLGDPNPRPRLEAVVACASRTEAEALPLALTALDSEVDKFIDYSLQQSVFATETAWLPAAQSGTLKFDKPAHLAFALETIGGEIAAALARKSLAGELSDEAKPRLMATLARVGNASDLSEVLAFAGDQQGETRLHLLERLLETWESRKVKPDRLAGERLQKFLDSEDVAVRIAVIRLVEAWRYLDLADAIETSAFDETLVAEERIAALGAFARLRGKAAVPALLPLVESTKTPAVIQRAALESLAVADLATAAETTARLLHQSKDGNVVTPLFTQSGGPAALADAFEKGEMPSSLVAQEILNALNRTGRTDAKLTPLLNRAIGIQSGAPPYDPDRVAAVVAAVKAGKGDPEKGQAVYLMAQLSCVACHRIGDAGGVIGPALSNVGAGMPLDQIVESVLWPDRQIKEGFQAVSMTTKDGKVITGYLEREGDDIIWYRNTTTPWILPVERKDIATRENIPTLMPTGLTSSLNDDQFLDLIAYLASLKG